MRKVLPFALLFVCSATVQAQQPVRQEPLERAAMQAVPASAGTTAAAIDSRVRSATAADVRAATLRAPAETRTSTDTDVIQGIDAPQNFWWLVGGIVLAGLILAVLL